jgi:outer membrane lipoprotein SlyB
MARFSASWRTTGAGSTTLPIASLYATAAVRPRVVEVGIFNTTSTAASFKLVRLTTAGTQGSTITAGYEDDNSQTAVTTAKDTHTVAPTLGAQIRPIELGAAQGSGIIFTFGGGKTSGLTIPNTTGDGIGIVVATGTGQICAVYFTWDE